MNGAASVCLLPDMTDTVFYNANQAAMDKAEDRLKAAVSAACQAAAQAFANDTYNASAYAGGVPELIRVGNNGNPTAAFPLYLCEGDCGKTFCGRNTFF